jgi:hypothetical protein
MSDEILQRTARALPDRLVAYRERLAARPAYQRAFTPQ